MKNTEVISDYVRGKTNKVKHLFSEEKEGVIALYSYGYHFPMCVTLLDGVKLVNLDGYSKTTSTHKGHLARELGFNDFNDLAKNHGNKILLLRTNEIKELLNENIKRVDEIIERKL